MTVVLAGLACGVAGVALAALVYERQLRRLARSLRERDAHSNTRLTVEAPGRGFAELAAAVNGQLDAAREERVEALRRQREFQRDLASLSHDVRTPLMGAKGYVRLAQDGRERPGDEEAVARHLAAAEARLDDMQALLDQLFAYAQASDPDLALDLRPVRVLPLLADVLVGHYPAFDERGWEPQVDFEDEALATDADPEALARIFENLVGNALRHGTSALAVRQRGRTVAFANEVADPAAIDVERLFERFYRADASRSASGAGLGLAVSQSLAEAMGMRMTAHLEGNALIVEVELAGSLTAGGPV
ncbi:sensor histidine kinase [Rubneribacter sp.]|nr:HAMP domain-containing histidine kinase [Candidatus Rubneribacter avistercoris]